MYLDYGGPHLLDVGLDAGHCAAPVERNGGWHVQRVLQNKNIEFQIDSAALSDLPKLQYIRKQRIFNFLILQTEGHVL